MITTPSSSLSYGMPAMNKYTHRAESFVEPFVTMINCATASGNAFIRQSMAVNRIKLSGSFCFCQRDVPSPVCCRAFSSSARDPGQIKADHDYCVDLVKKRDREGYLCGLLMPGRARKSYFAVRAFNVELASIKDGSERRRASEQMGSSLAMRMRMQWWRDSLQQLYPDDFSGVAQEPSAPGFLVSYTSEACWHNPVVRALHSAVEESNLTRRFLERLLDAREADLDIQQMATMEDAISYTEDTWSSLLYLSLECAGIREDSADAVAFHAGVGTGLTIALRSTIHRAGNGEMAIPADLFPRPVPPSYMRGRLDPDFNIDPEMEDIVRAAAQNMAYEASVQLSKARELQSSVPKAGKACLLPTVPAIYYLSRLKEGDFDLWDPKLTAKNSRLAVLARLGRSWLTGTI